VVNQELRERYMMSAGARACNGGLQWGRAPSGGGGDAPEAKSWKAFS